MEKKQKKKKRIKNYIYVLIHLMKPEKKKNLK